MKIHPVGAELFYVDGRTDRQTERQTDRQTETKKLIVTFWNFVNAPKNCIFNIQYNKNLQT